MKGSRPWRSGAPGVLAIKGGDVENLRVLRGVRMVGAFVDLEIAELLAAERPARKHPLDGLLHHALGKAPFEDRFGRPLFDAADIAGVVMIDLLVALAAGENHLFRIDDNDIVAVVDMRRKRRFVLAAQAHRDNRRQTPDDKALAVDEKPFLLDVGRFGRSGLAEHGILKSVSLKQSAPDGAPFRPGL